MINIKKYQQITKSHNGKLSHISGNCCIKAVKMKECLSFNGNLPLAFGHIFSHNEIREFETD